jgi:hypothetical protein
MNIARGIKDDLVKGVKRMVPDLRDVLVFGGIGAVGYGAWLIYPPAGFITVGVLFFFLGIR